MKKKVLMACATALLIYAPKLQAQNQFPSSGNVGINTGSGTPPYPFTVNADVYFGQQASVSPTYARRLIFGNSDGGLSLFGNSGDATGSSITLKSNSSFYGDGGIQFTAGQSPSTNDDAFTYNIYNSGSPVDLLNIRYDGTLIPNGDLKFSHQNSVFPSYARRLIFGNSDGGLSLFGNAGDASGACITLRSNSSYYGDGGIEFTAGQTPATNDVAFTYTIHNSGSKQALMNVMYNGKVVIGGSIMANMPGTYKLYVEDGILTEKIKVALSSTTQWSDFVFNDNYNLKPLAEVENYVKENKHLPEIPSADEVVKNGIDLGNMDSKLLQKIEELTLYVIQQQKEIETLKTKIK